MHNVNYYQYYPYIPTVAGQAPGLPEAKDRNVDQIIYSSIVGQEFAGAITALVIGLVRYVPDLLFSYTVVPAAHGTRNQPGWKRLPNIFFMGTLFNVLSTIVVRAIGKMSTRIEGEPGDIIMRGAQIATRDEARTISLVPSWMELLSMFIGSAVVDFLVMMVNIARAQPQTGIRKPLIYPVLGRDLQKKYENQQKKNLAKGKKKK